MTSLQLTFPVAPPKTCGVCAGWGELEATDIFCGAGGSSLGLESVCCPSCRRPLIRVTQALNHWPLAVEAHNANFPFADHDVHVVDEIPASRFRRTPLLWASPECTHHAYCRGPKEYDPDATRSRATFGDVVRFTAYHRYDAVIIENVVEARLWCDIRGHRKKCSCGGSFNRWHKAMRALGYESRIVYFNSQFALPTPQSRDRMYVVFWRRGIAAPNLDFSPPSWCSSCTTVVRGVQAWKQPRKGSVRSQPGMYEWGRYGAQYVYTCPLCASAVAPAVTGARTAIDFRLPMERIGEKKKQLAPKTRERIRGGLVKIAGLDPVTVQVGGNLFERRPGVRVWSVNDPLRTVVGTSQLALVVRYGGQGAAGRHVGEQMTTITAHDREIGLVIPNREHASGTGLDEPAGTITTAPAQHMLVQVNRSTPGKPNDRQASSLEEPMRTVAGHGELALAEFQRDTVEPMGTLTTRDREALVVTDEDIDACWFRMLQWPELLRAQQMHVHSDGRPYELNARRRDHRGRVRELSNEHRVKMIGNAVSSPVAAMLGAALVDVLVSESRASAPEDTSPDKERESFCV